MVQLLLVQSAMLGVLLTMLAALIYWLIERKRPTSRVFGDSSGLSTATSPGSSVSRPSPVGSDDSTAIRIRPTSTVDYIVAAPGMPAESPESGRAGEP